MGMIHQLVESGPVYFDIAIAVIPDDNIPPFVLLRQSLSIDGEKDAVGIVRFRGEDRVDTFSRVF